MVPRSAEQYVVERESSVFPTAWSRKPTAIAVARGRPEGRSRTAVPLPGAAPRRGARRARPGARPGHLRGQPRLAPGHPADPAVAAGRVAAAHGGRGRGRLLLRHLVAGGRLGGALQHVPDRASRRLDWPRRPERCWPTAGTWWSSPRAPARRTAGSASSGWAPPGSPSSNQVPVIPVAHRGTFAAMPRGQGWPSPGRRPVTVRFGEPLHPGPGRVRP